MQKELPDILYIKDRNNPTVDSHSSMYQIPYYKNNEYFSNLESYNSFIKDVEKMVRTNDRYSKYIAYLKNEVRLNRCQVLSNLDDEDVSIEMHHGPIFNLFDVCSIIVDYFLFKDWKINTFRITDFVLTEHQKNRVQVVMLSKTIHDSVHDRGIFIHYKHAYGDMNAFVKKYGYIFSDYHKEKFNAYVDRCLISDSSDYGLLKLSKQIASINRIKEVE